MDEAGKTVRAFMAENGVPGASIAIAKDDEIVCSEAFGLADRDAGQPVTERSLFRIASISKPITAVTVFRLIELGLLELSDRVFGSGGILGTEYGSLPYMRYVEEITVEHLLAHTAGGWLNDDNDPMFLNPQMNHAQLISWTLDNQELANPPGSSYAYSNFGYCLLGRIIEKRTGLTYAEAVRQRVLEACGVTDMTIAGRTRAEQQPSEVVYYGQEGDDPYSPPVTRMDSHGGWLASALDLVKFAVRVDGFPGVPDILTPASIRRMTTGSAANPNYALGWAVNASDNWWHGGSLPGTATLLVRTAGGLCWAALTNTRRPGLGADLDTLMWQVAEHGAW